MRQRTDGRRAAWARIAVLLATLALAACRSPATHQRRANETAYRLLQEKDAVVPGVAPGFRVETPYTARAPASIPPAEITADREQPGAVRVGLGDCLRLAEEHNRSFQRQREDLFLAALTLSTERHRYDWLPAGTVSATGERLAGGDASGTVGSAFSLGRLFRNGSQLTLTAANNLVRYYANDPRGSASSLLGLDFVMPLLRGSGAAIAAENLTQAERDVIYAMRNYARFQQTFGVELASRFYRLVQQQDTVTNEYNTYTNLRLGRQRAAALAGDRLPAFQVDQARQDELAARNRYLLAVQRYQDELDNFKLFLGLPLTHDLRLDPGELTTLQAQAPAPVTTTEVAAWELAKRRRLDLLNEFGRFDDAKRRVAVSADQLGMDLTLHAGATLPATGNAHFQDPEFRHWTGNLGLTADLPFDRVSEANAYRGALIDFERQLRALGEALDQVRDGLRGDLRGLDQARQRYQIQKTAVALAEKRVESANLLLLAGRVEVRDLLEAQNSLLAARNALTQALVDHHLARLSLWRDLGTLQWTPTGLQEAEPLPPPGAATVPAAGDNTDAAVITPAELFGN